jgi:hypothetical protein
MPFSLPLSVKSAYFREQSTVAILKSHERRASVENSKKNIRHTHPCFGDRDPFACDTACGRAIVWPCALRGAIRLDGAPIPRGLADLRC